MQQQEFLDKLKQIQHQIQISNNSLIQATTEGFMLDAIESFDKIQRQDFQDPSFEIVKEQLNQCYQFAMTPANLNKQWIINFGIKNQQKLFVQLLRDISEELKNRVIDGQTFSTIQGIIQLDSILVLDAKFTLKWEGQKEYSNYTTSLIFNKIANNVFKHNLLYDRMQQKEPQLKQLINQSNLLYDFCNFTIDIKKQKFSINVNHEHVGYNLSERYLRQLYNSLIAISEDMTLNLSPDKYIQIISLVSKHTHTNHSGMLYPQVKYISDSEKLQAPYVIVQQGQIQYQLEVNSELGQNIGIDTDDAVHLNMSQGDFFYFTSKEKRKNLKFIPNIRYGSMLFSNRAINFNLELVLQDKVSLTISTNLENVWSGLNNF